MTLAERAGQPADPSILVDVDRLIRAYYELVPDPAEPTQRVAFGTSGHRGSAFNTAFNEAHILATTEAICRYRRAQGTDGPLFIGRDTHALSEPAFRSALEVLAAHDVDVRVDSADGYTPTPVISHAILVHNRDRHDHLADGIVVTPSHNPPEDGGFKYNPPNGGPADTDVTGWIGREANGLLGSGDRRDPARPVRTRPRAARRSHDFVDSYVGDLDARHRHGGHPGVRASTGRRSARRCERRLLAGDRRALRAGPDGDQRSRRSAVRVHDHRLGRPDPDGSLVAARDGPPGGAPRSVRRRVRQ